MTTFACFIILEKNYNGPRTVSVKVLTLAVAAEPTFRAIKHLHSTSQTVTKSAWAGKKLVHNNMTALKNEFVLQARGYCTDFIASKLMSSQRTIFQVILEPKSVFKKIQVRYTLNNIIVFVRAVFNDIVLLPQNIPADKQRLIFKGKVLQDDKKLSEYGMMLLFCTFPCTINFN